MIDRVINFIERLNFSCPESLIGGHFEEMIALLSIVFGGAFLLFGYHHHKYFLGITGLFVGAWLGLIIKTSFAGGGAVSSFVFMTVCGALGCVVAISFERFVGILLGGFIVGCLALIVFPTLFEPGHDTYIALSLSFLMGGGLGAMFPRFFFIVNSSLIGSVFVTYGISSIVRGGFSLKMSCEAQIIMHLLVFLPLFIFGVIYQMETAPTGEENKESNSSKTAPSTSKV